MRWRPNETTPSISFHVWHLARWADYLQEMILAEGEQVWDREGLAARWGFDRVDLGFAETGLGMADEALSSLPFPAGEALRKYADEAFTQADRAVGGLRDDELERKVKDRHGAEWEEMTVGEAVLNWLVHDSRHLGMIECLLGVLGLHGTATR
jgi:hypothetical protein